MENTTTDNQGIACDTALSPLESLRASRDEYQRLEKEVVDKINFLNSLNSLNEQRLRLSGAILVYNDLIAQAEGTVVQ